MRDAKHSENWETTLAAHGERHSWQAEAVHQAYHSHHSHPRWGPQPDSHLHSHHHLPVLELHGHHESKRGRSAKGHHAHNSGEPREQPGEGASWESQKMGLRNGTAIYDVAAHTVTLPDGERLEAHSGLGPDEDNPRSAAEKNRGVTPQGTYDLTLRRGLFHGVQALVLNPEDPTKMHGRNGILAHTYMLGPNGQSNGCVSFSDYERFRKAYLQGEIKRIEVV